MAARTALWYTLALGLACLAMALPAAAFADSLAFLGPAFRFTPPGSSVNGGVSVKAFTTAGGALAGASVTFRAPASGPSFVFSNGAASITVSTDASGVARADLAANAMPGLAIVTASLAGANDASTRLAIIGPVTLDANWVHEADAGSLVDLSGTVHLPWLECTYADRAAQLLRDTSASASLNGVPLSGVSIFIPQTCSAGPDVHILVTAWTDRFVPGDYAVDLLVSLPQGLGLVEARAPLHIKAPVQVTTSSGAVLDFALYNSHGFSLYDDCAIVQAMAGRAGDSGWPASGPPGFDLPFGLLHVDATNCVAGNDLGTPRGPLALPALLGVPADLPDGASVWAYGPSADNPQAHWYSLDATTSGRFARWLLVDGGAGDDATTEDVALHSTIAVAIPRNGAAAGALQDLWWGGPAENGWGLSLTQHGSKLFGGLFIYDASGNPTWVVMPDGAWDAAGTVYQGSLYRPHGTRYDAYRAESLVPGAPVGSVRITVSSLSSLVLDYTIDGVSGRKTLQLQRFGPPDPMVTVSNLADLWWGGPEQNGWGFALAQQASTLFGVFFTYDVNGDPTWFVAPSATLRTTANTTSKLYRTHGSKWIGAPYDASRLDAVEVGQVNYKMVRDSGPLEITVDGFPLSLNVTRQPF